MENSNRIRLVGQRLIENYISTGMVDKGLNGPYDDPETEVRYRSHLLVIASIECLKYKRANLVNIIEKMVQELLSLKTQDGIYNMRQKQGKDQCNGVVGHAWLNEGLLYAYKVLMDENILDEVERIFLMHKFQPELGLWGRPLKGNGNNAIDFTLNHQLWYAATLGEFLEIRENDKLQK